MKNFEKVQVESRSELITPIGEAWISKDLKHILVKRPSPKGTINQMDFQYP